MSEVTQLHISFLTNKDVLRFEVLRKVISCYQLIENGMLISLSVDQFLISLLGVEIEKKTDIG